MSKTKDEPKDVPPADEKPVPIPPADEKPSIGRIVHVRPGRFEDGPWPMVITKVDGDKIDGTVFINPNLAPRAIFHGTAHAGTGHVCNVEYADVIRNMREGEDPPELVWNWPPRA